MKKGPVGDVASCDLDLHQVNKPIATRYRNASHARREVKLHGLRCSPTSPTTEARPAREPHNDPPPPQPERRRRRRRLSQRLATDEDADGPAGLTIRRDVDPRSRNRISRWLRTLPRAVTSAISRPWTRPHWRLSACVVRRFDPSNGSRRRILESTGESSSRCRFWHGGREGGERKCASSDGGFV